MYKSAYLYYHVYEFSSFRASWTVSMFHVKKNGILLNAWTVFCNNLFQNDLQSQTSRLGPIQLCFTKNVKSINVLLDLLLFGGGVIIKLYK